MCGPDGAEQTGDIQKFSFSVRLTTPLTCCVEQLLVVSLAFFALARPPLERLTREELALTVAGGVGGGTVKVGGSRREAGPA